MIVKNSLFLFLFLFLIKSDEKIVNANMGNCVRPSDAKTLMNGGNPQSDLDVHVDVHGLDGASEGRSKMTVLDIDEIVQVEVVQDRIAVVTLKGGQDANEEEFEWGTRICEHRINPRMIRALNKALDLAEKDAMNIAAVVVTGEGKFFSNGMDLKFIDKYPGEAHKLQQDAELLLGRILTFGLPTIAGINGHFAAAGGMLGLSFDYRIMSTTRGYFFVPAIDLGLVYSDGMTELMKAKTPVHMHNDMIVYGKKYKAKDLEKEKVILEACPQEQVLKASIKHAMALTKGGRFGNAKYRSTMHKIKRNTYKEAYKHLTDVENIQGMGFEDGEWDASGRAKL